jgi:hypothetical protein
VNLRCPAAAETIRQQLARNEWTASRRNQSDAKDITDIHLISIDFIVTKLSQDSMTLYENA